MNDFNSNICFVPIPKIFLEFSEKFLKQDNLPYWVENLNFQNIKSPVDLFNHQIHDEELKKLDPKTITALNQMAINAINFEKARYANILLGDNKQYYGQVFSALHIPEYFSTLIKRLEGNGISQPKILAEKKLADLFILPAFGVSKVFSCALILERYCLDKNSLNDESSSETETSFLPGNKRQVISDSEIEDRFYKILERLMDRENVDQLSLGDLRFGPIVKEINNENRLNRLPHHILMTDTLSEYLDFLIENIPSDSDHLKSLIFSLNDLEKEIEDISNLSFKDQVLAPFFKYRPRENNERKEILLKYLGLNGNDPLTLEEVGKMLPGKIKTKEKGVSRERVRQIIKKFLTDFSSRRPFIPKLYDVLDLLDQNVPISDEDVQKLLDKNGYGRFSIKSLETICSSYCVDWGFEIKKKKISTDGKNKQIRILSTPGDKLYGKVFKFARRMAGTSGFVNLEDLSDRFFINHEIETSPKAIRQILVNGPYVEIEKDWLINTEIKVHRNRFLNITFKMLYAHSPISVSDIREGMKREFFYRKIMQKDWPWKLPTSQVLQSFFETSEIFDVNDDGLISADEYVEKYEPAPFLKIYKEIINATPYGIIDNRSLKKNFDSQGVKKNSYELYLSYAPYIQRFEYAIWGIRGSKPTPDAISNLIDYVKDIPRKRRKLQEGFNENGEIVVIIKIYDPARTQISLSHDFSRYLEDTFISKTVDGKSSGEIFYYEDKRGNSSMLGLGKIVSKMNLEENDLVRITFNLDNKEALFEQVPESIIWDI